MRNKFAGDCYRCGLRVEIGTGHFERMKGKGWRVQHALYAGSGAVTCNMAAALMPRTASIARHDGRHASE